MWDRFKGAVPQKLGGRSQQQHKQRPQFGLDKNAYAGGAGYSYSVQGGVPPPRPAREFEQPLHFYDNSASVIEQVPGQSQHRNYAHRNSAGSNRRPASSVYSQPSPIHTSFAPVSTAPPRRSYTFNDGDEISPPSSPEETTPRHGALPVPDISPIDEDDEIYNGKMSQPPSFSQVMRNNIPSLRRERRQKMDAASSQLRESKSRDKMRLPQPKPTELSKRGYHGGEVRWDPATGELTSSEKGRPSQVKPAEYAKEFGDSPPRAAASAAPAISTSTPFGERVRRIAPPGFATGGAEKALRAPAAQTPPRRTPSPMSSPTAYDPAASAFAAADRPEWKGGSGRSAIVKPVHDTPDVAPLKIPRKQTKRSLASPGATSSPVAAGLSNVMASPPASPAAPETLRSPRETRQQMDPSSHPPPPEEQENEEANIPPANYPSPPQPSGQAVAPEDTAATSPNPMYPLSPESTSPTSAVRRKPTPSQLSLQQQQNSINSRYSQSDPFNYETYAATNKLPHANSNTFNAGAHGDWAYLSPKSPEPSYDAAGAPRTLGDDYGRNESPSRDGGVMGRMRPKLRNGGSGSTTPSSDDEPIKISLGGGQWANRDRKALGMAAVSSKSSSDYDGGHARRSSMAGSIHKTLPPAPPETTAKDRVDQLNAQLRGLANRRLNLTRCIKQMTELMPTDNIMASSEVLRKREIERKKVEALKMELAEVQREEYDLGIKLHRAYKRIDRTGEYEPTTLWVKRVTGY
ncbi:hypothetical protein PpBr36_07321 [Pyricularia pennisetigena]|uniref:hypothetical protein n=1 Tax=Pyricularia pennisetigena TaxID=1578925 RepID=UPI00115478CC|nr:hypothetical protein PpBr36_07321 [Pyricularia pennisetigena]TLS25354.1 hypothetical protein PpBr36_07321 [Pyricularia pennisetigena]